MVGHSKLKAISWVGAAILAGFGLFSLGAKSAGDAPTKIPHLVVERLDVVEPDGTLRTVIYSKARDPQIVVRGKTYPHPSRTQSGMLFYNDEGTEVGGLVFAGSKDAEGNRGSGGSLTFDAYEQDQIVRVLGYRQNGEGVSGIDVSDRPDEPMDFDRMTALAEAKSDEERQRIAEEANFSGTDRAFFGRAWNEDSTVVLRDGDGRKRLVMRVGAAGDAEIQFLNEAGEVTRTIGPDELDAG